MDKLAGLFFSPWLNREETKAVESQQLKNFTYVQYQRNDLKDKIFFGRYNKVTKEVMWEDAAPILGGKCLVILTLGISVELAYREIYCIAQVISLIFQTICCRKKITELPANLAKHLSNMISVVFYVTGIAFAALGGLLFDPLRARKRIGLLEEKLNQGVTYAECRQMDRDQKEKKPQARKNYGEWFYLAPCMQPLVTDLSDKSRWTVFKESDKLEEVSGTKKVKECVCQKWCIFPLLPGCVS